MKTFIILLLSAIWLNSVFATPLLKVMSDDIPYLSVNMNEEEPQEQDKLDIGEDYIFSQPNHLILLQFQNRNTRLFSENPSKVFSFTTKIQLPPPETSF
jgi:hypothetical protein